MATLNEKALPYEEFNMEVPEDEFPKIGISARAARAIVLSEEWTDANPIPRTIGHTAGGMLSGD